jgi:hypothetical protein
VSALKGVQSLTETQEHVKNYGSKVRIICERSEGGPVSHRDPGTRQEIQGYRPKVRIICERSEGGPVSHKGTESCQELHTYKVRIICERSEGDQSLTRTQEHVKNYRPKVRIIFETMNIEKNVILICAPDPLIALPEP